MTDQLEYAELKHYKKLTLEEFEKGLIELMINTALPRITKEGDLYRYEDGDVVILGTKDMIKEIYGRF